jgi:hypothetical protein
MCVALSLSVARRVLSWLVKWARSDIFVCAAGDEVVIGSAVRVGVDYICVRICRVGKRCDCLNLNSNFPWHLR